MNMVGMGSNVASCKDVHRKCSLYVNYTHCIEKALKIGREHNIQKGKKLAEFMEKIREFKASREFRIVEYWELAKLD